MSAIKNFFIDLQRDEDGAAFLEYTVLLGIILAVSVAVIFAVGAWAADVWNIVCGALNDATTSSSALTVGCS